MKSFLKCAAALALSLSAISCSPHLALRRTETLSESRVLKAHCATLSIATHETQSADSLLTVAEHLLKRGKTEKALFHADHASVLYRIALASREHGLSVQRVNRAQGELIRVRDQVSMYKGILEEIRKNRRP